MTKRKLALPDWLEKHESDYVQWVNGICEPGYDDKETLLANWNNITTDDLKYAARYNQEWEDEWVQCDSCGKIFRSSPDSYQWEMYGIIRDGEAVCGDCLDIVEYLESIENNPRIALTSALLWKYKPIEQYGYELVQGDYENGFHPGQNDDPAKILATELEHNPTGKYIFVIDSQGQFDIGFSLYRKIVTDETE